MAKPILPKASSLRSEVTVRPRHPLSMYPMEFIAHTLHDAGCKFQQRGSYMEIVEGFNPTFFDKYGFPHKTAREARAWFEKKWTYSDRRTAPNTECRAECAIEQLCFFEGMTYRTYICGHPVIEPAERCVCYGMNQPHFHRICAACGAKWEEAPEDMWSFEWCYAWIQTAISEGWATFGAIPSLDKFRSEKLAQIDAAWACASACTATLTIGAEEAEKQLGLFGYVKTRTHRHAHSAKRLEVSHVIQQARPRLLSTQGEGTMLLWTV
jgi:hypothetical protein